MAEQEQHADEVGKKADAAKRRKVDPVDRRDRAQRRHRGDRGNEDQPHAHRLQHDHLRGAGLHHRPVHAGGRDRLDRHRPADLHPRHGGDREGQDQAFRHQEHAARATSTSPTTPTPPAAISITSRFTLPIFHKGKLVGFSCCMAHWLDVGGVLGGMTTDIYSEGLQIPILKYQDRGKVNQDLVDIIRMNVRLPTARHGRPARADHGGEDRRAALPRTARPLRPRGGAGLDRRRSWTTPRRRRARAPAPSPTASTRRSPSWTTTASTSASASRSRSRSSSRATR